MSPPRAISWPSRRFESEAPSMASTLRYEIEMSPLAETRANLAPEAAPMYDLIELFYFAYRDFVGDADRLLEAYGFGRAHHRVLHFVARHPGLTIAELLDILAITKQSLNRVLKELIAKDFID